jgi:hypothetical protein
MNVPNGAGIPSRYSAGIASSGRIVAILDAFLVLIGWPKSSQEESFAETRTQAERNRTPHDNERCAEDSRARRDPDS